MSLTHPTCCRSPLAVSQRLYNHSRWSVTHHAGIPGLKAWSIFEPSEGRTKVASRVTQNAYVFLIDSKNDDVSSQ